MSLTNVYAELEKVDELNAEKILQFLLTSDKNLSLKTHINQPVEITLLQVLSNILKINKAKKSSVIIDDLIKIYKENMISFRRLSREEITKTLSAIKREKQNVSITEKLLGMRKNEWNARNKNNNS